MQQVHTRDRKNNTRVRDIGVLDGVIENRKNAIPESSFETLRFLKCKSCRRKRFCSPACQLFSEHAERIISLEHRVLRNETSWDNLNERELRVMDRILHQWKHNATIVNHPSSQMALGMIYEYGYGVKKDEDEAIKWYKMSSEQNLTEAKKRIAKMVRDGRGTRPNDKKALLIYRDAARAGDAEAFYNIGKLYQHGRGGLVANEKKSVSLMKVASRLDKDLMRSQTSLGLAYLKGIGGTKKDVHEAARLFSIAADQGYARAQHNLGLLYDKGVGVEKSPETAAMWWKRAATQGHPQSKHNLALRYMQGQRNEWLPQADTEAVILFRQAAAHLYGPSFTCLALCYEHGVGDCPVDIPKAIELCHAALDEEYEPARPHLERLRTRQIYLEFGDDEESNSQDDDGWVVGGGQDGSLESSTISGQPDWSSFG